MSDETNPTGRGHWGDALREMMERTHRKSGDTGVSAQMWFQKQMGVSENTVRFWLRSKDMPAIKSGKDSELVSLFGLRRTADLYDLEVFARAPELMDVRDGIESMVALCRTFSYLTGTQAYRLVKIADAVGSEMGRGDWRLDLLESMAELRRADRRRFEKILELAYVADGNAEAQQRQDAAGA